MTGPQVGAPRRISGWLRRRWGAGVAVLVGALLWGADVATLREGVLLLVLVYAITAALGRPRAAWPVLFAACLLFVGATAQDRISADAVLIGTAVGALVLGTARRRDSDVLALQAVGVAVFSTAALVAAEVAPGPARYIVAGAWAAHAAWDFAHLRARRAVSASYAEYCCVVDLIVAVMLVVTGL